MKKAQRKKSKDWPFTTLINSHIYFLARIAFKRSRWKWNNGIVPNWNTVLVL